MNEKIFSFPWLKEKPVVLGMCKKLLLQDFTIDYGPLFRGSSIWVCSTVCRIKI